MTRPNILVIAGHDPSGGAGIQADIESVAANRGHAASVVTLLTCQDTSSVYDIRPVDGPFFQHCLDIVRADMTFAAIKTGVIADTDQVERIAQLAGELPDVPLIVDPVLRAAGGATLADDAVGTAVRERLFPLADVITPNAREAALLCDGETDIDACGARLCASGCDVLITGGDAETTDVVNRFYRAGQCMRNDRWPRLQGTFHGSGCTLASAIAAQLGRGRNIYSALDAAQAYTDRTLQQAFAAGRGQAIPARWEPAY